MNGIVFKIESKDYYLFDEVGREVRCSLRGKLLKEHNLKKDKLYDLDIVVVGDSVGFELNQDGTGVIEEIFPRKNFISRKAPRIKGASTKGERLEQKIASNIDNLIIVNSVKNPILNNRFIDRLLVIGESSNVNCSIVINKVDLDRRGDYKAGIEIYRTIGYEVIETSVAANVGIAQWKNLIQGKTSLIWGYSGVGKSSLLNFAFPFLKLKTGAVSDSTSKGKHTTVTSLLSVIDETTKVIDTPGIREVDPYGIREEDLGHYFRDFVPFINNCKFNTCTHLHEPECAVIKAVNEGLILQDRYYSYTNILESIEDDMNFNF